MLGGLGDERLDDADINGFEIGSGVVDRVEARQRDALGGEVDDRRMARRADIAVLGGGQRRPGRGKQVISAGRPQADDHDAPGVSAQAPGDADAEFPTVSGTTGGDTAPWERSQRP